MACAYQSHNAAGTGHGNLHPRKNADGFEHLGFQFLGFERREAFFHIAFDQIARHSIQRGLDGHYLQEYFITGALLNDHALNPFDLPLDAPQVLKDLRFFRHAVISSMPNERISSIKIPVWGILIPKH
jgi:hypothetical protein